MDPGWATAFYGMTVTPEIAAAADEALTDRAVTDLVDAHLGINHAYFGAIDKTLAGFVILDDTGDDYTLLDLRAGGQVWWQSHETRELSLVRDSLAAGDAPAGLVARSTRRVTTPALCARYQWLVWLLARPIQQDGVALQSTDYLVRAGIRRFRHTWPRRDAHDAAFESELGELRDDPHLAIYWLLHTTVLVDHPRRLRVVEAIGPATTELVRQFIARLGMLPLAGDLPVVPEFRARRALALTYGAFELAAEDVAATCLTALEVSPATSSLLHALQIVAGLDKALDAAAVAAVLARIPESTQGTELVHAALDKRAGTTASAHADALARLIAVAPEPWWLALEALWLTHELAYDAPALVAATRAIVGRDRYHRRALQMAMRAAQMAGEPSSQNRRDRGRPRPRRRRGRAVPGARRATGGVGDDGGRGAARSHACARMARAPACRAQQATRRARGVGRRDGGRPARRRRARRDRVRGARRGDAGRGGRGDRPHGRSCGSRARRGSCSRASTGRSRRRTTSPRSSSSSARARRRWSRSRRGSRSCSSA